MMTIGYRLGLRDIALGRVFFIMGHIILLGLSGLESRIVMVRK